MSIDFTQFTFSADSPWGICLSHYVRNLAQRSTHTQTVYAGILARFFAQVHKSPERVTQADIEDFIYQPTDKGWRKNADGTPSVATVNLRVAAIASFYRYASGYMIEDNGEFHPLFDRANPTVGIIRGKPERSYRVLTYEQFERFFSVIPDTPVGIRDRCIFLFYFWSGRRRSEIQRLLWKDIQASPLVSSGYVYRFRNKGKPHIDDAMELPKPAVDALFHYLETSGRLPTMKPESPLFVAIGPEKGGNVRPGEERMLTQRGIVNRLRIYAEKTGIDVSLHVFRHTAAKERLQAGMDIVDLRDYLRHASLDQTYHYARGLLGTSDPAAKLLEARFGRFSKS